VLTLSSLFSTAWSYRGIGYSITKTAVGVFNLLIIIGVILSYVVSGLVAFSMEILGSIIGAGGVAVCVS
jgi:hypothetical protein